MADPANDQVEFWDRRAGAWERRADVIDRASDPYGTAAMEALAPRPGEQMAEIGCGPGMTVVELARRVGPEGTVLAVDVSEAMLAAAGRRVAATGQTNVRFVRHDLVDGPVAHGLDAAYSRFGVMFFADPHAAFSALLASLRPGGRLGCVVWGALADNPWMFVPTLAAAEALGATPPIPMPGEPGPFALADPAMITSILDTAGFTDVAVSRIDGSRRVELARAEEEILALLEIGPFGLDAAATDQDTLRSAVEGVTAAMEPYRDGDGWSMPGSALLVVARRS